MTRLPPDDNVPGHPLTGPEWMLPARRVLALVVAALLTTVLLSAVVAHGGRAGLVGGVETPPAGADRPIAG